MRKIASAIGRKCTSSITLLELELVLKRELGESFGLQAETLARAAIPEIEVVDFTLEQFQKSLELREKYGFGIFDSIHAAVALEKHAQMASTDKAYDKLPQLNRIR